ncbi:MAG: signal peptidase II [Pseudomonadota bacterium]
MTQLPSKTEIADRLAEARANPLFIYGLVAAAAVVILDQATKFWIVNIVELPIHRRIEISSIFDLTYVQNRGASFGMLAGGLASRLLLSSISIVIAGVMIVWLGRLKRPVAAAGAALIIGGAIGNLYDRIRYGYVVDFLDFSGLMFPWVFNVADTAINIGFACLILDALLQKDGKTAK